SREAEGTGPLTPRQPAPKSKVPNPAGRLAREDVERDKGELSACYIPSVPHLQDRVRPRGDWCLLELLRPSRPGVRRRAASTHGDARADRRRPTVALALRTVPADRRARRAASGPGAHAARRRPTARPR